MSEVPAVIKERVHPEDIDLDRGGVWLGQFLYDAVQVYERVSKSFPDALPYLRAEVPVPFDKVQEWIDKGDDYRGELW